ncbi:MAG: 16S rRNA (cytosine(1402)-N(4))-methyltransferase RsmH [Chloroflexi bacterium]|nr:16S rRNA (cytosine(1402)-N(4))-methyltransferase RsmH [Chloroflexota bacterium]
MVADLHIYHMPVLVDEAISALQPHPGGKYIDGTLGEGGFAEALVSLGGDVLGLDADPEVFPIASRRLEQRSGTFSLVQANFADLVSVATTLGFRPVDGIILDLGLSSRQLQAEQRGFTFQGEQPLDMRFDPAQEVTAADLVNELPEEELVDLFRTYGEEDTRSARAIARSIIASRPLRTTRDLSQAVQDAVGQRSAARINPATKVFMSLRITVNAELQALETALPQALELLAPGGRLVVISYHSLEDRIVKRFAQEESRNCICPPRQPVCNCGHIARVRAVGRRSVTPSLDEITRNPASRSARLRAVERVSIAA